MFLLNSHPSIQQSNLTFLINLATLTLASRIFVSTQILKPINFGNFHEIGCVFDNPPPPPPPPTPYKVDTFPTNLLWLVPLNPFTFQWSIWNTYQLHQERDPCLWAQLAKRRLDRLGCEAKVQEAVLLPKWRLDTSHGSLRQEVLRERSVVRAKLS